ncbi:hypothetical protein BWQ96_03411 [Gracilariopsis chorda]|uniref:C2H2-type domain-containing protein n=1 Tax=Gracilariopsis chorda TaxID=448386 RepID=A0A2V3IXL2_9FLOR|nr:hypothetical protein BWQ96_03411 [Gracilariopsis chorda]|eukprot:PXF46882.1 hypothetical protein BWQ96_03411 [Gracilariopsis chorda]
MSTPGSASQNQRSVEQQSRIPWPVAGCSRTFGSEQSKSRHRNATHAGGSGTEKGAYSCTQCSSTFDSKGGLSKHKKEKH